ncbi:MAG: MMPL family transporter [Treponema sp.]|uniref:efflux RND transporter permease subunit n=1 Tax=Treponema sp. TaxID=166 RepID=UPI00298DC463|nr:MMPL family transporter [Treponema sp.]MCR5387356.1 MMPL family transporter [Treponema sp.]
MKVSKINSFFRKIGEAQIKHRWICLIVLLAVTLFCLSGMRNFRSESTNEDWIVNGSEIQKNSNHFKDVFGNDQYVLVLVQADDVFSYDVLSMIDRLGDKLEQEVPFAEKVTSLTTISIPTGVEGGLDIKSPYDDGIPTDPEELAQKKNFILSRESIVNNLVSDDSKETWISLKLRPFENESEDVLVVGHEAEKIIMSDEFKSDSWTLMPIGSAYTTAEKTDTISTDFSRRIMLGFITMLICLIIFVRSPSGVIVPFIATLCGIGTVLGFTGLLNIPADSDLMSLPLLLGMALSIGYALHYINAFKMHFRQTGKRKESVIQAVEESGWPILFTVITTAVSLLSFMFANIRPMLWLGAVAASVVMMVYIYVVVLIPIFLSFGKDKNPVINTVKGATKADLAFENFGKKIVKRSKIVAAFSFVIILACIPGIFKMEVNMDYLKFMGNKVPFIQRIEKVLATKIGNLYSYDIMIEFEEEDAFKNPENMMALERLEDDLGKLRMTKITNGKPRVRSITRMVKEMYRVLNNDDPAFYTIPSERDMLTQLLFFYEISDSSALYDDLSETYNAAHVHVEITDYNANIIVDDINDAEASARKYFPDAKVCVVGTVAENAAMNATVVISELKSFGSSFVMIALLLMIVFGSIRTGLIAMIPNIAPVLLIGAVMGYSHMPLDEVTMMIMPMILGIAVDDTIHFSNHIKTKLEVGKSYGEAVTESFREIGKTMGTTTFILCAMFLMYTFSPITAMFRIGLLSIIGLSSALIADYTLTPALIYLLKPLGKKDEQ